MLATFGGDKVTIRAGEALLPAVEGPDSRR
jgi:hypothetical protein